MASTSNEEKVNQMEATYKEMLAKYNKEADNVLNTIKNNLIKRIGALEEATKQ